MKILNKYGMGMALVAASSFMLTGCIDETFPTQNATTGQVGGNSGAMEAMLMAIPAQLNTETLGRGAHWDFGYPSLMHVRDVMTQDMATANDNMYNQFSSWGQNVYQGVDYAYAQMLWTQQTSYVNGANLLIKTVNTETANDAQLGYLGAALAYRAMFYLDMGREYEFLENDAVDPVNEDGNNVLGLTVPIVDENTTDDQARNNPRVDRATLGAFIESDLKKAEQYITKLNIADKSLPHLDCVYGLYARLYMWLEKYDLAEEYARKAIDNCTGHVMTQEEALNTSTGFNTATPWMWGVHINKESMINNLQNYCSFFSCETTWGYSTPEAGSEIMIDRSMYERISDTDWRKLMWKAPAGSALDGQNTYCDPAIGEALKDYSSLKFRPAAGNVSDFSAGGEMDYPLMRVEEMYFIEAEAAARQTDGVARAASLLENFMKANRDASYTCGITVQERLIEEILFQKRIELWGEGQAFFDIKRCNIPCTRSYTGSNHVPDEAFNTTTRPAWMNWVIDYYEQVNNYDITEKNNPDPSDAYDPVPFE